MPTIASIAPECMSSAVHALLSPESDFYNSTAMRRQDPHLALLLERASRAVADRLGRSIGLGGITSDHWRVLKHLADAVGHPMGEVAERLDRKSTRLNSSHR